MVQRVSRLGALLALASGLTLATNAAAQFKRAAPSSGLSDAVPAADAAPDAPAAPARSAELAQPAPSIKPRTPGSASASAAPIASAPAAEKAFEVRLNDKIVFRLRAGHGAESAEQRAETAEQALATAVDGATPEEVRVEHQADVAVIFVGKIPVVQLYNRDAALAGDASLAVHAATTSAQIREAMRSEQKRSAIVSTVFHLALAIVFGLLALYLIRKVGDLAIRARNFIHDNPERIGAIRVQSIELVRPALLRGGLLFALGVGKWLAQLGIAYGWLTFTLSLFELTRPYTERLNDFFLHPIAALFGRFAASLPVLLVAVIAGIVLYLLVRFIGLFLAGVARGETILPWLPPDLALPTSLLLRAALVIGALVFGAPVITGDPEGALARSGSVVLGALAFASTPLLACAVTGAAGVFLRRLRVGEFAEFGGRTGRVVEVGLLEVRLEDAQGCEIRVPHLLSLVHPTRLLGAAPRISVVLGIVPSAPQARVRELLLRTASSLGQNADVEVVSIEPDVIQLRVSLAAPQLQTLATLQAHILDALAAEKISIARPRGTP
jgi:small-conductance mechanosensitive channel